MVPKGIRDALSLVGGAEVEVTLRDGAITIEPVGVDLQWEVAGRISFPVVPLHSGLSDEEIRAAIEGARR